MTDNFVKGNVAYHTTLAQEAWAGNELKPEVRYKLLNAARMFIDTLEVPNFRLLDIVLTGSMANYNYTKFSDFDVHVVTQYADLECEDLAETFYRAKKTIWNNEHDIIVRGHEVEMYVEDVDEPPVSAGVFSLLDNKWLKLPERKEPSIDDRAVNLKVADLTRRIDHVIHSADDADDIRRIQDKLRKMRRAGLDQGGEFSVENLAYKILRNLGYLDRLSKALDDQIDQGLSL
jgi:predicted nucleotidyltransferase